MGRLEQYALHSIACMPNKCWHLQMQSDQGEGSDGK